MLATRPVGRYASVVKYDILSALGVLALSGQGANGTSVLRFVVLMTTRYNWQSGQLAIGRAEIARLWSVNERTVKREMAKFRQAGWLSVRHAGVRGRVTVYDIDLGQILIDTRPVWPLIGPDFEARMQEGRGAEPDPAANVVPFPRPAPPAAAEGDDLWGRVLAVLHERDPGLCSAWFAHLSEAERAGGTVSLIAPTRFMADYVATHLAARLLAAYSRFDPTVRAVKLLVAGEG